MSTSANSPELSLLAGLRPEAELITLGARTHVTPWSGARMRALLGQDLDWLYLITTALRHKVLPLLSRQLDALCPEAAPPDTLAGFRDHFRSNARRNEALAGELLALLHQLSDRGIDAMPYKGPVLAAVAYGDLALREFGDLDVLVRPSDAPAAREALCSLGYRPARQEGEAVTRDGQWALSYHQEFRCEGRQAGVELHWGFGPRSFRFPLDPSVLWERRETATVAGTTVATLAIADLLPILCVHGSKHCWSRLSWICDIAEIIRARPELDWGYVCRRARVLGAERRLLVGLALATGLLEAPLTGEVRERLEKDRVVQWLAGQIRDWIFAPTDGPPGAFTGQYGVQVMERRWDRLRFGLDLCRQYPRGIGVWVRQFPRYASLLGTLVSPRATPPAAKG